MGGGMTRSRIVVLATSLALCAAWPLAGDGLGVKYLEGTVEIEQRAGWTGAAIGAPVPADASVRVGADSMIEIGLPAGTIFLNQPGTYSIRGILTTMQSLDAAGTGRTFARAFRSFFGEKGQGRSAILGVRGADEAQDEQQWSTSSASIYLSEGKDFIASGDGTKARDQLERALEAASDAEIPEIRFTLASALVLDGDVPEALSQLSRVVPQESDPWAEDFAILKSQLLLDSYAYPQELAWLDTWGPRLEDDARRAPLYHLLRALGERGMRDTSAEKNELLLVSASADGDLAKTAAALLGDL